MGKVPFYRGKLGTNQVWSDQSVLKKHCPMYYTVLYYPPYTDCRPQYTIRERRSCASKLSRKIKEKLTWNVARIKLADCRLHAIIYAVLLPMPISHWALAGAGTMAQQGNCSGDSKWTSPNWPAMLTMEVESNRFLEIQQAAGPTLFWKLQQPSIVEFIYCMGTKIYSRFTAGCCTVPLASSEV